MAQVVKYRGLHTSIPTSISCCKLRHHKQLLATIIVCVCVGGGDVSNKNYVRLDLSHLIRYSMKRCK
jgi:hypothetical protein